MTGSVMSIVAYASLFTLALIDFNRYVKVLKRSLYRKVFPQNRAARLYRVLVWMVAICLSIILLGGWVRVSYHPKFGIWSFETDLYTLLFAGVLVNGIVIIIFY